MEHNICEILISIIRSAFGIPVDSFEIDASIIPEIEMISVKHNILPIVTAGMKNLNLANLLSENMIQSEAKSIYDYTQRKVSLTEISNVFEIAAIPYIPLKGSVLRDYYPYPWMRTSSDIDVLIQKKDLDQAISLINSNSSFKCYKIARHDAHFINQFVHLELHYNFEYGVEKIDVALADPWKYAVKCNGSWKFDFTSEYLLFYIICHAAKHLIQNGGVGIRSILDIYLLTINTIYNEENVKALCDSAGVLGFYNACVKLINVWFNNVDYDKFSKAFEEFIVSGGVFGSSQLKILSNKRRDQGKNYLFSRVFKSRKELQKSYPKLKKYPFLLPCYQIKRWIYLIKLKHSKEFLSEIKNSNSITQQDVDKYDEIMNAMGL